jgi:exodeoxyribonuclease VII large subunit
MSYVTIDNICKQISSKIGNEISLQNITCKCVVKKVSQYPYMVYIDIVDINLPLHILSATINTHIYKEQIKINDIIIIKGNIIFQKSINFKISSYYIDKPQISNYEKILQDLKNNNILDIDKKHIPQLINNIAIISSTNAAGLKDCLTIINHLPLKNIYIYPVTLQGSYMQESVYNAIKQCNKDRLERKIDLILLIRGGGSKTDLEWFDNYKIAKQIKKSIIPIICGIGHEIDHTIMDIVCDKSLNTPTHVGTYLCELFNVQKNFNHVINNIYVQKMKLLLNNFFHINECILQHNKLLNKDLENICDKINNSYEQKNNKLINIYEKIINSVNIYIEKYDKISKYLIDDSNKIDMELHNIYDKISHLIEKYGTIKLWNNETKQWIISKADMIIAKQSGQKISIEFFDGSYLL